MKFTKMQACGNDYIYIDCTKKQINLSKEKIKTLSNRNFGIGSDGIILIKLSEKADFKMEMYNSDGSYSAMCGNGLRSVAKFVYFYKLTTKQDITIQTGDKVIKAKLHINEKDEVKKVSINMGKPFLKPAQIPTLYETNKDFIVNEPLNIENYTFYITTVNMGNPHVVIFLDNLDEIDINKIGKKIENHPLFPEKTNVNFVSITGKNTLEQKTWERGTGQTLACGSGACSVLVASYLNKKTDRKVSISLMGGILEIEWLENEEIIMTGPAEIVFEGNIVE